MFIMYTIHISCVLSKAKYILGNNISSASSPWNDQYDCLPDRFKQALVMNLLKKSTLDKDTFKNDEPVPNLDFIWKVTEKAAVATKLILDLTLTTAFPI